MARIVRSRLAFLVVSFAVLIPGPAAAFPPDQSIADLGSRLTAWLMAWWGDVGCSLDPSGACGERLDVGCSADPNGGCGERLDIGCSMDPDGGSCAGGN